MINQTKLNQHYIQGVLGGRVNKSHSSPSNSLSRYSLCETIKKKTYKDNNVVALVTIDFMI